MSKPEDDFWNTSSHSGFNFDDEEDSFDQPGEDFIFNSLTEESFELPIHLVISKSSLNIILEDIRSTLPVLTTPVEETIVNMIQGYKYSLQGYVKFPDKIKLLDQALDTCDANVIVKVIIYLKETLKRNIFYHHLSKRKTAVKHYGYYLITKNLLDEVSDLYMATGNTSLMKQTFYLSGQGVVNKIQLQKKLEKFMQQHLQELNSNQDKSELYDNLHLLNYQIDRKCSGNSVVKELVDLCKSDLANQKGLENLYEFKRSFKIDDFTFDWALLNVFCSMKLWINLKDLFIKTNWLTKKNVLKTSINPETFLDILNRHNTPKEVLEEILVCISDTEKAIFLACVFKCHNFVIHHYIQQKDRQSLLSYKEKLLPHTPEYYFIESSLQSLEKKKKY